ncbi:NUDIX hydrolase [Clostridium uliginosum]|uniref:NUDIX domain-containing protein n=1 Tax=Clostridium uliginosum TaxID=119641 RepID=A0A1I1GYV7_9CLOT|nr:CoA pyrophosphatase [Clostridium uliginosum]SFC16844.1 NUDIX domain-containing protein [Clostridium uliginosum]
MNIEKIKDKIEKITPYINGWERMKRASVIIPLVEIEDEVYVLFEVRAKKLISQPGDICFPGGKIDGDEIPKETALREAFEELGLKNIDIIKELDIVIRHDSTIIHPFLGIVNDIETIKINESEVDHVFYVPLQYLLTYEPVESIGKLVVKRAEDFPYNLIVNGESYKFREGKYRSLFYKYKDYVIWGITAEMLKSLLDKL